MTARKKFKRFVREHIPLGSSYQATINAMQARIARTGEHYTVALPRMLRGEPEPRSMTDAEVFAEYGPHLGVPLPEET